MASDDARRFDELYKRHKRALKLWGYAERTVDSYSRALVRLWKYFQCLPGSLSVDQLETYFAELVETHSWATVKVGRNGLQFFWKHILERDWSWIEIIRPPKVQTLPDILTVQEVEQLIASARKLRYRVFVLTTYTMGLRLSETLSLAVGDIDRALGQIHIRRGKGHKDRFVPIPDLTYQGLRALWAKHRHPFFLFPSDSGAGSPEEIRLATKHMNTSSTQKAIRAMLADCGMEEGSRRTRCAIVSRPTCTSEGSACGTFRSYSAIVAPRRPHSTLG